MKMAEFTIHDNTSLISKGLYHIVRDVVGPESIVKLRRQTYYASDLFVNCDTANQLHLITSGSMSEGFLFYSSDIDKMCVDRNSFVLATSNRLNLQNTQYPSIFCMEDEECSPGFTLLRCLTCDEENDVVFRSLLRRGNNKYLSSKAVRETFLSSSLTEVHGPCQSENLMGMDIDFAYALNCPVWPILAKSFVIRSLDSGWPSYDVLKDICMDGCLFIPINSKQQTCHEVMDLEWRMSFSLAEKKLINSMNHCQFLCYGLTKVFLNEVLKKRPPIHDLLCSYFMKTAVFWEIYDNSLDWSINTFSSKFWNVFRRLLKWVNDGYCPNFFIPENNMFYGKICGKNQRVLLSILRDLYEDGFSCLLRCESLNKNLTMIIRNPRISQTFSNNEEDYCHKNWIQMETLCVIMKFGVPLPTGDVKRIITNLHNTANITIESELMMCATRLRVSRILQHYTDSLLTFDYNQFKSNRQHYKAMRATYGILINTRTYFCTKYLLYAKCTYMNGDYQSTIAILIFIKRKLQSQRFMYTWSLNPEIIMRSRQSGIPYDSLMKSFMMSYFEMNTFNSIEELKLECIAQAEKIDGDLLCIPPLPFINFLIVLCYTRQGNYNKRSDVVDELRTLLYLDDNFHIPINRKAISWEILGICHQICGDRQAAFRSYMYALNDRFNHFEEATIYRIKSLFT